MKIVKYAIITLFVVSIAVYTWNWHNNKKNADSTIPVIEIGKEPVSYTHLDVYKRQHSGSENHGCEAIVRSTCKMLKDNYKTILLSSAVKADKKYCIDHICDRLISVKEYKKTTVEYLKYAFKYRFKSKYASPFPAACWKIKKDIKNSIALSIGCLLYTSLFDGS